MIRRVRKTDIDRILKLNKEEFGDRKELSWTWDRKYVYNSLRSKNRYLMEIKGKLIGAIHYFKEYHGLCLMSIAVHKHCHGMGYGRMLMHFLERRARQLHKREIILDSRKKNSGFYKKLGYNILENDIEEGGYSRYKKEMK